LQNAEDSAGRTRLAALVGKGSASPAVVARFAPLAVVILALLLGYAFGLHRHLSLEALGAYQQDLSTFVERNAAGAALAYVLIYTAAVAVSFPGASVLTAAGGLMFGCITGTLLALASATTGAALIFLIARTSLGDFLAMRAGPRIQRLRKGFQEEGFSYLLFLRLVPLFPFWLVNLAAALFGMRLLPYVAATLIGIIPGTFVLSYFGQGLGSALEGEGSPYWLEMLAGRLALVGIVVLIPVAYRKWRRRHAAGQASG
jgi:uncharacterized membrane protein YdjX (TVP38/TMEM64 family)